MKRRVRGEKVAAELKCEKVRRRLSLKVLRGSRTGKDRLCELGFGCVSRQNGKKQTRRGLSWGL